MRIRVRLHGVLRRSASASQLELDLHEGATVASVIESLGLRPGQVWLATLDDRVVEMDHPLGPGDRLALIPPVGGG
jgi:molybdopterin synthase sulfur carrier subunit